MSTPPPPPVADETRAFESSLEEPARRYLAAALDHSMRMGLRTPGDFFRHFSASDVMHSLNDRPQPRAVIVERATGLKRNIGVHKNVAECAADLHLALEHGELDPTEIVRLLNPDDIARYASSERLWRYIEEDKFWLVDATNPDVFRAAQAHIAFLLERALTEHLLEHDELIEWLTADEVAQHLPRDILGSLLQGALDSGRADRPFTAAHVFLIVPAAALVHHVPLAHIWRAVLVPVSERLHGVANDEVGTATVVARPPAVPLAPPPVVDESRITELVVEEPDDRFDLHIDIDTPAPVHRAHPRITTARTGNR